MKLFIPCVCCGKKAEWSYMPGANNYCDNCVPRGCSCNLELKEGIDIESEEAEDPKNYYEPTDDKGRKFPCCEYGLIDPKAHNNPDIVNAGWETYYTYYPEKRQESDEVEFWEDKLGME